MNSIRSERTSRDLLETLIQTVRNPMYLFGVPHASCAELQ